jgi:hypothetical protein
MIAELDELSRRRVAKYRQEAISATTASLRQTFGDAAESALASPTACAAIATYVDSILELQCAHAAFRWADAATTAPFVDAAVAYRDAQIALLAAVEIIARDVACATQH